MSTLPSVAVSGNPSSVPQIRLEEGDFGTYLLVNETTGEDVLIQTDWDFPDVACTFGFAIPEPPEGLIQCQCDLIQEARQWLDDHIGETTEDPGYFTSPNPQR